MSDDMLPPGAARDPRAPYNQEDVEYVCSSCREPADVVSDDELFTCEDCGEEGYAISTEEIKQQEYEDYMERKGEEMRERRRFGDE